METQLLISRPQNTEVILDYPGSPSIIIGPEKWKSHRWKSQSECHREGRPAETGAVGGMQWVSTPGRSKEIDSPSSLQEDPNPVDTLMLACGPV